MPKVFVTGSSGLLAANIIIELLAQHYSVTACLRDRSKFLLPYSKDINLVELDISDETALENSMTGCDFIIHTASETRQGLTKYSDYHAPNVENTKNIFKAAIKNKIKKVIYVSTANVFGFGSIKEPGNENSPLTKPFSDSLYVKSKMEAQRTALEFSDKIDVIIVNPTFLIGPYDQKPSSGRIVLMGYGKKIVFYPPGGKNFLDVKDAAKAIVSALTNGKNREAYILSGENLSYREFFSKVSRLSGHETTLMKIPGFVLLALGCIGSLLSFFEIKTEVNITNMRILCVKNYYSNKKAENELGIKFKSVDQAIKDAIEWFRVNKRIT